MITHRPVASDARPACAVHATIAGAHQPGYPVQAAATTGSVTNWRASFSRFRASAAKALIFWSVPTVERLVLPFGPEPFDHNPVDVGKGSPLDVSQTIVRREQVLAVGVVVAEDTRLS